MGHASVVLAYGKALVLSPVLGVGGLDMYHILTTWFLICISKMALNDDGNAGIA